MKKFLKLVTGLALVVLINGCASTGSSHSTTSDSRPPSNGPTISGYVDTSVGTRW